MARSAVLRPHAALTLLLVTILAVLGGVTRPAHAADGDVIISAGGWLQGHGVDVRGNGGNGSTYFQCVELPKMRLYPKLGWPAVGVAGNGGAAYIPEGSPGLLRYNPGSGYVPVPGDLVIENPHGGNPYGHVAVVDHTAGGTIWAVEQNGSRSGWHPYTYNGSLYGGGYGPVKAILHAPQNTFTNPPGAVGEDLAQARTPLIRSASVADRSSLTGVSAASASVTTLGLLAPASPAGGWPLYSCLAGNDAFTSRDNTCDGQRVVGRLGYAYATPPPAVPSRLLYRCRSAVTLDRFDSTDPACEGQTVDKTLGYVLAAAPVLRWTSGTDRAAAVSTPGPAYRSDALLGYLPLQAPAGGRAIYTCTTAGTDLFLSLDAACEGQQRLGRVGYSYATKPVGLPSRQVYRCISLGTPYGEQFESTDAACEGQRMTGSLGYALTSLGVPSFLPPASRTVVRVSARPRVENAYVGATAGCIAGFSGATSVVYAWLRDATPLRHQRTATYAVAPADLGHTLTCTAVASTVSSSATSTSAAVNVAPPRLRVVTAPAIRGSVRVGSALRASAGVWAPKPSSYRYQWLRDGVVMRGATSSIYRPATRDRRHRLAVRVTALEGTHSPTSATSTGQRVS